MKAVATSGLRRAVCEDMCEAASHKEGNRAVIGHSLLLIRRNSNFSPGQLALSHSQQRESDLARPFIIFADLKVLKAEEEEPSALSPVPPSNPQHLAGSMGPFGERPPSGASRPWGASRGTGSSRKSALLPSRAVVQLFLPRGPLAPLKRYLKLGFVTELIQKWVRSRLGPLLHIHREYFFLGSE